MNDKKNIIIMYDILCHYRDIEITLNTGKKYHKLVSFDDVGTDEIFYNKVLSLKIGEQKDINILMILFFCVYVKSPIISFPNKTDTAEKWMSHIKSSELSYLFSCSIEIEENDILDGDSILTIDDIIYKLDSDNPGFLLGG